MSGLRTFSSALTFAMMLIFATMVAVASTYPPGARFMPYVVGIPAVLFCAIQLVLDWKKASLPPARSGHPPVPEGAEIPIVEIMEEPPVLRRELAMWGYFLGFVALLLAFGFYVAVPALVFLFLWREAGIGWRIALLTALGSVATLYVIFEIVLRLRLFEGRYGPAALRLLGL